MKKLSLTCFLTVAISVPTAFAQLQQYDGFAYTVGSTLAGNGTWTTNNTGTAPLIASGNLSVSGLQAPTGEKVSWEPGNIQEALNTFGTTLTSGTVFFSMALQLTNLPTSTSYSFMLGSSGSTFGNTIWVRTNGLGGFNLGINKGTTAANTVYASDNLSLSNTYFIVSSYEFVSGTLNDIANLWVNPDSSTFGAGSAPSVSAFATNSGGDVANISVFQLRGANGSPGGVMDELRIGTDWASVTPVPEPSTYALLGLAAAGLGAHIIRRRRR